MDDPNEDEDMISPNERRPMRLLDSRRQADGELSDSDDEGDLPRAFLSRSPRRPSEAPVASARSVSYSAVESELSFSRDLFSYFDDDEESVSSSYSGSSEDTFF